MGELGIYSADALQLILKSQCDVLRRIRSGFMPIAVVGFLARGKGCWISYAVISGTGLGEGGVI